MYATKEDIRRAAGNLLTCGFDGTSVTAELKEIMREVNPAGIILFARNVEEPAQVAELTRELKMLRPDHPLALSVDQEGGRVARIREPATEWPPMRVLGEIGDPELTRQVAIVIARELRAMGFDINYAPVLDVDSNPDNPVIGDRSFSPETHLCATLGAAFVAGMQSEGIGACGKHFPGHGDTDVDSHLALPRVSHDLDRLRKVEWPPFQAAINAGLGAIMTAHVVVEGVDDSQPATFSPKILAMLRQDLGFNGVIISDDLEMKAVADRYSAEEMAHIGINAGIDHFLVCHMPEIILEVYRGIIRAVEDERVSHRALLQAEKRVLHWTRKYYRPPGNMAEVTQIVGSSEHLNLRQEIETRKRLLA